MEERSHTVPAPQTGLQPSSLPYIPHKVHANQRKICNVSSPSGPPRHLESASNPLPKPAHRGVSYRGRAEIRLRGALLEGPRAGEPPRRPAPRGSRAMLLPRPGRCCRWPAPRGPSSGSRSVGPHPGAAHGVAAPAPGTGGQRSGAPAAESPGGGGTVTRRSPGHAPTSARPHPRIPGPGVGPCARGGP